MVKTCAKSYSGLIATTLTGAWRRTPPAIKISAEELGAVATLLLNSGCGALAWWRVRDSELCISPSAMQMQQKYRRYAIHKVLQERDITQIFALLHSAGVEAMLIKGWAAARLYAEPGLRAPGDIDLVVRPEQYDLAKATLESRVDKLYPVDLEHREISELDNRNFDELYARSQSVRLHEGDVRVLSPEDHLRVLCIHMLKHGAWRPLWLCGYCGGARVPPKRL